MSEDPTRRTAYGVTSGEYSDYRVHAMFDTREDAQRCADRLSRTRSHYDVDVQEFPMYGPGGGDEYRNRPEFHADLVVREGRIVEPCDGCEDFLGAEDPPTSLTVTPIPSRPAPGWKGPVIYRVEATGASREAALKAVRERAARVAALVAEGLDPDAVQYESSRSVAS